MKFSYLELLKQSLRLSWRFKVLWIFGVLAIPFSSVGVLAFLNQSEALAFLTGVWSWIVTTLSFTELKSLYETSPSDFFSFWLFLLLNGIATVAFMWFAVLSQFVIIKKFGGDQNVKTSLNDSFRGFFQKEQGVFSIFGLYIGAKALVIILSVLSTLPALSMFWLKGFYTQTLVSALGWTLSFAVVICTLLIYFVVLFGVNYIILKKASLKEAILKSVRLIAGNLLVGIEFLVVMLVLTWLVSYISVVFLNLNILILGIFFHIVIPSILGLVLGTLLTIIFVLVILSLIGFVTVFQFGFGTLLFSTLIKGNRIGFIQSLLKRS